MRPASAPEVRRRFDEHDYLADEGTATAVHLALSLGLPLLLEGEPGVGKTTAAKVLAQVLDVPLVRLQCYEGLTAAEALYDWNYQRQLLAIRLAEAQHERLAESDLFTEEFLGEGSVTVPDLGTFAARQPPVVVLTSNRSRDLHDALRRRCLYHWIDFPAPERAAEIVRRAVPGAAEPLIRAATAFIGRVRELDLDKAPGLAETIDWVSALSALGATGLVQDNVRDTIGTIAKTPDDRIAVADAVRVAGAGDHQEARP